MRTIQVRAPAKLNLFLDILGLRPDGYHDLEMLMQAVSLCDDIEITLDTFKERQIICVTPEGDPIPEIPCDSRNLAWRAADLFYSAGGFPDNGLTIRIVKRIPAQAGLAGGSADAAAVLRGLKELCRDWNPPSPGPLAEQCGSDVPFCLHGGTAWVLGRGEIVQPIEFSALLHYVIVKPPFGVSTPALFKAFDQNASEPRPDKERRMSDAQRLLSCLRAGDPSHIGPLLRNALEPVASQFHPEILQIREALLALGACGARMTGSGSAVFGLFPDEDSARRACEALKGGENAVFYAHSL